MCDSDDLLPHCPAATRRVLFGVLAHSLQGHFKQGKFWFQSFNDPVLEVELKITTSKYLLKYLSPPVNFSRKVRDRVCQLHSLPKTEKLEF